MRSGIVVFWGESEEFNLNNYSSVSNAISRVKRRLRNNKFKKCYGQIFDS